MHDSTRPRRGRRSGTRRNCLTCPGYRPMISICTDPGESVLMPLVRVVVRVSIAGALVAAVSLSCVAFAVANPVQGDKKQPAKMEEGQRMEAQTLIALV